MPKFKSFKVSHGSIEDQYFYGREKDIKSLERRLRDGQHSYFVANRQMGKTSLALKSIERYQNNHDIALAHVDLWGVASFAEAGESLVNNYMRERFGVSDFSKRIMISVSEIAKQVLKKYSGVDIKTALDKFKTEAPDGGSYFLKSIQLILDIESMRQKRVVLFIDEFQELYKFKDMLVSGGDTNESGSKLSPGKVLLKRLRALLQNHSNVTLFAAGSEETLMNNLFGKTDEAFMKGALAVRVPPIEFEAYKSHFEDVCRYENIEVSLATIRLFYYLGGGIPYYLSSLGRQYVDLVVDDELDLEDATKQAIMSVMLDEHPFFSEKINQIKHNASNGLLFYKNLGQPHPIKMTAEQCNVSHQAIAQTANKMVEGGFVRSFGHGKYAPVLPLLYLYTFGADDEKADMIDNAFGQALKKPEILLSQFFNLARMWHHVGKFLTFLIIK